ncbi:hypothetical protein SSS_05275 [Sarcoptes scabiei]|uniref:Uncharacterized protein n=1 Tax=Sarcoptes scabiei TaxID=52283 RepID=A0A834VCV1_SARSC|nr:hypothetical protein SSS_05275 [Sarcoptes scabiei]UXI14389.1 hypothetical protein NH340_JMT00332 [Sarcoptes scabiei]
MMKLTKPSIVLFAVFLCFMMDRFQTIRTSSIDSNDPQSSMIEGKNIRQKRDAFSALIKKKGLKAAAAGIVAAASITKKKFFPLPIPFPVPILKPPIIETIPVPIGLGHIGGFGPGFIGGGFAGGYGR